MRYLTPRKSAEGLGAARTGTHDHWVMTVTAVSLVFLVPCFVFVLGTAIGRPQAEVVLLFSRPFPAIVTALVAVVGMLHFARGAKTMIEDYTGGITRELAVIAANGVAYVIMFTVLYALGKMVFLGTLIEAMK